MNTPQTDTPETERLSKSCDNFEQFIAKFEVMERRALAAEARVKELEEKIADVERRNYDTNRRLSDVLAEHAALRLRPMAEAGPVPSGSDWAMRLYAHRIPYGPCGGDFWAAFSEPGEEDTHFIDIYPPQQ